MLEPFRLSLQLALTTSLILLVLGLPLIYLIHFRGGRLNALLKALVSLPLVLPPTVLGYYLLVALRPESGMGAWLETVFGLKLAFSFGGLVIGSLIFSLPFMVNPILSALEGLPKSYTEAAFVMGKSSWNTYWRVLIPNVRSAIIVGTVMAFAHTIGEFGVVLMIGGNIPERTRVASIAIYQEVEALRYDQANQYALILLLISFVVLLSVYLLSSQRNPT